MEGNKELLAMANMMAQGSKVLLGTCENYVLDSNFDNYLEGLKNYFALNKITEDEMKVRLLINLIGTEASAKIIKALKPKVFTDFKYSELVKVCEDLFGVQRNSIVEHYKFNNRFQKEGESLGDFAIECQALAEFCEFGEFLDTALRDRFVAGIRNNKTKKVLLGLGSKKKFSEVVAVAKREELLQIETEKMQIAETSGVNAMNAPTFQRRGTFRNRGGKMFSGERRGRRNFNHAIGRCHRCGKIGHWARDCREVINSPNKAPHLAPNVVGPAQQKPRNEQGYTNAIDESFGHLNIEQETEESDDGAERLIAQSSVRRKTSSTNISVGNGQNFNGY
jgi:hypothetical protein